MASAFAHRLFTRGHVKYVSFHGDRSSSGGGFFVGEGGDVTQSAVSLSHPAASKSFLPSSALAEG